MTSGGIVCVSKRRAMRGYTGESRVRGGLKARDPAPQLSLLTLKPEEILRDVSGRRTGLTCRARCRRRRRSRRRGPPPGWSRVAATAPGLAPSWSTVRRIVARWQDTTVKRQSRFLSPRDLGLDSKKWARFLPLTSCKALNTSRINAVQFARSVALFSRRGSSPTVQAGEHRDTSHLTAVVATREPRARTPRRRSARVSVASSDKHLAHLQHERAAS